jgi:hypothetical protein
MRDLILIIISFIISVTLIWFCVSFISLNPLLFFNIFNNEYSRNIEYRVYLLCVVPVLTVIINCSIDYLINTNWR